MLCILRSALNMHCNGHFSIAMYMSQVCDGTALDTRHLEVR